MTIDEFEVNNNMEDLGGEVSENDFAENGEESLQNDLSEEESAQFSDNQEKDVAGGDVETAFENDAFQASDNDTVEQVANAFGGSTAFDTESSIQSEQAQPVPDAVQKDGVVQATTAAGSSEAVANAVASAFETATGTEVDKDTGSLSGSGKTGDSTDAAAVGDAFLDSGEWSVEKADTDPESQFLEQVNALKDVPGAEAFKDYFKNSEDSLAYKKTLFDTITGENFKHDVGSWLNCFDALRATAEYKGETITEVLSVAGVLADAMVADGNPADVDASVLVEVYLEHKKQSDPDLGSAVPAADAVAITRAIGKYYSAEQPFSGKLETCSKLFTELKGNSGLANGNVDGAAEIAVIATGIENENIKDALVAHLKAKKSHVEEQLKLAAFIQYYDRLEPLDVPSVSSATDNESLTKIEEQRMAARLRNELTRRVEAYATDPTFMDTLAKEIANDAVDLDKQAITDSSFTALLDKVKNIDPVYVDASNIDIGKEYNWALDKFLSKNKGFPDVQRKVVDFIKSHDNFVDLLGTYFTYYGRSFDDANFDFEVAVDCIPIVQERLEQAAQLKKQLSGADADLFDYYERNQTDPYQRRDDIDYIYENRASFSEKFARCVEVFGKPELTTQSGDFIYEYGRILHLMRMLERYEYTSNQSIHQGFDEKEVMGFKSTTAAESVSLVSRSFLKMAAGDSKLTPVEQFDAAMQRATRRLANDDYNAFPDSGLGKLIADAKYGNSGLDAIKTAEATMDTSIFAPEEKLTFDAVADAVNTANGDHRINAEELGAHGIRQPKDLESYVNARLIKEIYQNDAFAGLRETDSFKTFDETNTLKKIVEKQEKKSGKKKKMSSALLREPTINRYIDEFSSSILKNEDLLSGNGGFWKAELTKLRQTYALEVLDAMYRAPQKRCDAITTESLDTMISDAGINFRGYGKENYKNFFARMDSQAFADFVDFNGDLWKLKNPLANMKDAHSRNVGDVGGYLELPHYASYARGRMDKMMYDYYQQNKDTLFTFTKEELATMSDEQLSGMTNEALGSMSADAQAKMTDEQRIAVYKQDPIIMTEAEFKVMAMQDSSTIPDAVVNYQAYRQTKLILLKQELQALGGDLDGLGKAVNNENIDLNVLETAHNMDAAKEELHTVFMKSISR